MRGKESIGISSEEEGNRLDRVFHQRFSHLSFGRIQKAIRSGEIRVNKQRKEASYRVCLGDVIRIPPPFYEISSDSQTIVSCAPKTKISKEEIDDFEKRILYEDKDFIVWNKPFGFAVQGGTKVQKHLDALLDRLTALGRFSKEGRPSLVHRLDRDTTGLLLIAKTRKMASFLARGFAEKKISKLYWALVVGSLNKGSGKVKVSLSKKQVAQKEKIMIDEEGRNSETLYSVLDQAGEKITWLVLRPLTGRTHQLRVHCAHLGVPILGDGKYGSTVEGWDRKLSQKMCLHAFGMRLSLPNGEIKTFHAPLPPHMRDLFKILGFESTRLMTQKSEALFEA